MSRNFIKAALELARYEAIEEDKRVYGEIAELPGVWASGKTLEECRRNLSVIIESWIVFRKNEGFAIPPIKGIAWADEGAAFEHGTALIEGGFWRKLNSGFSKVKQWFY